MAETSLPRKLPLRTRFLLATGGIGIGVLLVGLILTLFPGLIPGVYDRKEKGQTLHIEYRVSSGDLFTNMPGKIRPIPPDEDALLAAFDVSWDENGFREPHRQASRYPIVAVGDSFTEAVIVEFPWPDLLAEALNVPVYNYGYRAYGPYETQQVIREFVLDKPPAWILYGFFAGNDLYDISRSFTIKERKSLFLMEGLVESAVENVQTESSDHYDFPMPTIIGSNYYEMAFLAEFLWVQQAPDRGFAASRNLQFVDEMLAEVTRYAPDTCRALIFIPTKEQLYYPYIYTSERRWMRGIGQRQVINDEGWLSLESAPLAESDEPEFLQRLGDQRDALRQLAEQNQWYFIDLLPAFTEAVSRGDLLYYPYDSHWNPAGHALASAVIADFMRRVPECPLE